MIKIRRKKENMMLNCEEIEAEKTKEKKNKNTRCEVLKPCV